MLKRITKEIYHYFIISRSGLFDNAYYLRSYPDIREADVDPLWHFVRIGWKEGRNPSRDFNVSNYLRNNADVKFLGVNPLVHFIKFGRFEGRDQGTLGGIDGKSQKPQSPVIEKPVDTDFIRIQKFNIVPFYLDTTCEIGDNRITNPGRFAVHIGLSHKNSLQRFVHYLNNIPYSYDIYISSSFEVNLKKASKLIKETCIKAEKISIMQCECAESDLVSMVINFKEELSKYDYLLHIHDQFEEKDLAPKNGTELDVLLGSPQVVSQIISILQIDGKFAYHDPTELTCVRGSDWGKYKDTADAIMKKLLGKSIELFPIIEFPRKSMFWVTGRSIKKFLDLPIQVYRDEDVYSKEFSAVFRRLLLISAMREEGRNYRLSILASNCHDNEYENQRDYSGLIKAESVKVLSFYLPQFYPTPENDKWHGKGFTEWNKVKSSNPLFYGHYQQRGPHDDLGYYTLDATILKKQAEMMKKSGVYGQVFYHYWFSGRLILEKPAQTLLKNKSIDMPFCFCWANENWTRAWDGNEEDVLLSQRYSNEDSIAFIEYLIPFFKDERYIKINKRPVIFIYRPGLISNFRIYRKNWEKVCSRNGLNKPYIVSVLTRETKSPEIIKAQAGCERVLHDWTRGRVKAINQELYLYQSICRDVLPYDGVADFYIKQKSQNSFTYFRSLIPTWDNTPRYGSDALVVHGSTPHKFQEWLRVLVADAENRLEENERIILINAWNEWAESAYLEPDKKFGYAYLNSVGRALSCISFDSREYLEQPIRNGIRLCIQIDQEFLGRLQKHIKTRTKFISCINRSTIFQMCEVFSTQKVVVEWINNDGNESILFKTDLANADYILNINNLCYFPPDTIENMLKMTLRYDVGIVTPTHMNDKDFTHRLTERWETSQESAYLYLAKRKRNNLIKCCVDARIFISDFPTDSAYLPIVSTILRFSGKDNKMLLENALYSLASQVDCIVQPVLNLNNVPSNVREDVITLVDNIPWENNEYPPIITLYGSDQDRDLRSQMLNESLKRVGTQFVAFLDYDDVIFCNAYQWLISRLKLTGKKVSFGLIYYLVYNFEKRIIKERFINQQLGKSYEEFLKGNNTPIHGFMIDVIKVNLQNIQYFEDMKYMEDYYLTLQIFDEENTDWDSLKQGVFIGDYIHYEDKIQTLGLLDSGERKSLLNLKEYKACQVRIDEIRQELFKGREIIDR